MVRRLCMNFKEQIDAFFELCEEFFEEIESGGYAHDEKKIDT